MKNQFFKKISNEEIKLNYNLFSPQLKMLLMLFISLIFFKCSQDTDKIVKNLPVTRRVCEPGNFTFDDGKIVFEDNEAYTQTVEFFSCASQEDLEDWDSELEIMTPGKALREFMAELNAGLTDEQYRDLLEEYDGIIKVTYSPSDSSDSFTSLYPALNDICNLDGEFQIDDAIIKIVGDKIISITKPGIVDPSSVDEITETDTSDGVFVYNILGLVASPACCPASNSNTNYYDNLPRKRLITEYQINNLTTITSLPNGKFDITPLIEVKSTYIGQKRTGVWPFRRWSTNYTNMNASSDVILTHNLPILPSPIEFGYVDQSLSGPAEITTTVSTFQSVFAKFRPGQLIVCLTMIDQELVDIDVNPDHSINLDCN